MYTFLAGPAVSRRRMGTKRYLKLYYDQIMSMVAKFMHCWRNCRNTTVSSLVFSVSVLFFKLSQSDSAKMKRTSRKLIWTCSHALGLFWRSQIYILCIEYFNRYCNLRWTIHSIRFALQWSHSFECVAVFRIWCIGNAINAWTVHIHFRFSA